MVNYYKILGLENYASVKAVRTAYIQKIRQYHPDINPSAQAKEVAQVLNEAKEALSTEDKKNRYDRQLRLAYVIQQNKVNRRPERRKVDKQYVFEQRKKREEQEKILDQKNYAKSLTYLPFWSRLALVGLILILGIYVISRNVFLSTNLIEVAGLGFAAVLLIVAMSIAVNEIYKHFDHKFFRKAASFDYGRLCWRILMFGTPSIFILSFVIIYAGSVLSFKENFEYAYARIHKGKSHQGQNFVYSFSADGETFNIREDVSSLGNEAYSRLFSQKYIIIKYFPHNPRLSKIDVEANFEKKKWIIKTSL